MTDRATLAHLEAPVEAGATPIWRQIIRLAWPVLLQQSLIFSVGLWDRFLAGNNTPADESLHVAFQAAQTNAAYMIWFLSAYSYFVSIGSTALVARFVGARDFTMARRATSQAMVLAIALGVFGSIMGLLLVGPFIRLLGVPGPAADIAVQFLRPLLALLVFQVIEAAGIACLVGAGDTRTGLIITTCVAVLNMPLSWCLLHGYGPIPELGISGIAYGTACSYLIGGTMVTIILLRGRAGLRLLPAQLLPDFRLIYRILRISVPAALDSMSVLAGQFWFLSLVNDLGDEAITAHGVALQWEALGYLSANAFGISAMSLVGRNLGARQPVLAARSGWRALLIGGGFVCFMGLVFFTLAPQMFRLVCPYEHQRPVVEMGIPVLRLVAFATPGLSCCIILTAALRGAGDTRWPVLFTWIGFLCVRIPLAYLLTGQHTLFDGRLVLHGWNVGLFGAWLAMFADLYVRGGFFLFRFARGRWKATKV
jgi:putative MATE family efflux protein